MSSFQYLALFLFWVLCLWPEEAEDLLIDIQFHLAIFIANCRLNWIKWRLHQFRVKLGRENGWPDPGPFQLERFLSEDDF